MKQIPLTQGKFAIVDDEDYEELSKYKWCAIYSPKTKSFYASRRALVNGKKKPIAMHRQILDFPDKLVDHINKDTLDNRKNNLRICSYSQNNMNKRVQSNNKLGLKNIIFVETANKFRVQIYVKRKMVYSAYFDTLKEAIIYRDEALKKYHGEFANKGK